MSDSELVFLFSDPLVDAEERSSSVLRLDYRSEIQLLRDALYDAKRVISLRVGVATRRNFLEFLRLKPTVVHWVGHGHRDYLVFENGFGAVERIMVHEIAEWITQAKVAEFLKVVFVSACHSQNAGEAFVNAGIPHVVCVRLEQQVSDESARSFAKRFYLGLLEGQTVKMAFKTAQTQVANLPGLSQESRDRQSDKYLLLPKEGDHDKRVLAGLRQSKSDEMIEDLGPMVSNSCDRVPSPFIGREAALQESTEFIIRNKVLAIHGNKGVGKSALGLALCEYIAERNIVDTIHYVNFTRTLQSLGGIVPKEGLDVMQDHRWLLVQAIRTACTDQASVAQSDVQLFEAFRKKRVLLFLDGCEKWCHLKSSQTAAGGGTASIAIPPKVISPFSSSSSSSAFITGESFSSPSLLWAGAARQDVQAPPPSRAKFQRSDSSSGLDISTTVQASRTQALISFIHDFMLNVPLGMLLLTGREPLAFSAQGRTFSQLPSQISLPPLDPIQAALLFAEISQRTFTESELTMHDEFTQKRPENGAASKNNGSSSEQNGRDNILKLLSRHHVLMCLCGNPKAIKIVAEMLRVDQNLNLNLLQPHAVATAQQLNLPLEARVQANVRRHISSSSARTSSLMSTSPETVQQKGSAVTARETTSQQLLATPASSSVRQHHLAPMASATASLYSTPSDALNSDFHELWKKCMKQTKGSRQVPWISFVPVLQSEFCETVYYRKNIPVGLERSTSNTSDRPRMRNLESADLIEIRQKLEEIALKLGRSLGTTPSKSGTEKAAATPPSGGGSSSSTGNIEEEVLYPFWKDWFLPTLELLQRIEPYWTEKVIHGFTSRENSEALLRKCSVGTFLIRPSSSNGGKLALAFVKNNGGIGHSLMEPTSPEEDEEEEVSNTCGFKLPMEEGPTNFASLGEAIMKTSALAIQYPARSKEDIIKALNL